MQDFFILCKCSFTFSIFLPLWKKLEKGKGGKPITIGLFPFIKNLVDKWYSLKTKQDPNKALCLKTNRKLFALKKYIHIYYMVKFVTYYIIIQDIYNVYIYRNVHTYISGNATLCKPNMISSFTLFLEDLNLGCWTNTFRIVHFLPMFGS